MLCRLLTKLVGRNSEQVKKMSSRMSRKQSMRWRGAEDGPEVQKTERRNQGEEQQLLVEKEADDITKNPTSWTWATLEICWSCLVVNNKYSSIYRNAVSMYNAGWLQSWIAELTEAEHLKELKQSMGTRLAEGGPEVQRMESSSQWEERSSGEASISLSSQLVNSYEVSELFDRTW